jgi:hypothetical protein
MSDSFDNMCLFMDLNEDLQRSCRGGKLLGELKLWTYFCLWTTEWNQELSSDRNAKLGAYLVVVVSY